jgi:hypothetical protein
MATSTSAKTDLKVGLVSLLLIGAIAAFFAVKGGPDKGPVGPDSDLYETVTLSVTFKPVTRVVGIEIQAHVESVPVVPPGLVVLSSPWNSGPITIRKGAAVTLYALQQASGDLDCVISRNGVTVDHNHRADPGSIRCYMNRPTR